MDIQYGLSNAMQCNFGWSGLKNKDLVHSPMVMFSHLQCNNILVGLVYMRKIMVGLLVNVLPGALLKEFFLVCPIIK